MKVIKVDQKYQWQGEPVEVRFGYVEVTEVLDKPLYWYNYEVWLSTNGRAHIHAVEVTYQDYKFNISNKYGFAMYKLLNGGGPKMPHASLPDDNFIEDDSARIVEFDREGYSRYVEYRDHYFMSKYPAEFKKMRSLEAMIKNKNSKFF